MIEEMAQFIDSLDLEVLALEEVEDAEALDLLLSFMPPGKYAYIVSPQTAPETCQRVAVLSQKEEVAMRYVGEIPLSLGPYGLRDGLVVYGRFLPDGFDFTLVVVHLKAYSDPRSTSIREEELSLLGQWVQTYLDDPENDRVFGVSENQFQGTVGPGALGPRVNPGGPPLTSRAKPAWRPRKGQGSGRCIPPYSLGDRA